MQAAGNDLAALHEFHERLGYPVQQDVFVLTEVLVAIREVRDSAEHLATYTCTAQGIGRTVERLADVEDVSGVEAGNRAAERCDFNPD